MGNVNFLASGARPSCYPNQPSRRQRVVKFVDMEVCRPCIDLGCDNPPDLAAGIDSAIYSQLDYSFIVQCPDGCYCPPGLFPQTIIILASTIPPVIPPITEPGADIILRLQGCSSLIVRTLPSTSTQAEIQAAAVSMQAEWAGQQSICNALLLPGINCTAPANLITVCNDAQEVNCFSQGVIQVPAGTQCRRVSIAGLTPTQVAALIAQIKSQLNALAIGTICPFIELFCDPPFSVSTHGPGADTVTVICHNFSITKTFSSSGFKLWNRNNDTLIANSVFATVAPGASSVLISVSPVGVPFYVTYFGVRVYDHPDIQTANTDITFNVGCGT